MTTYIPNEGLDSDPVAPYTWDELVDLITHWRVYGEEMPAELRELNDGRVVDAAWDPADNPNPTVYATRSSK